MKLRPTLAWLCGARLCAVALLAGCATGALSPAATPSSEKRLVAAAKDPETDIGQAADGYRIAKEHCASCHAIDAASPSPHADAPPLRTVLEIIPEDMLADHLIEGVRIGHDDMPRFDFTIRAADALVAYLKSVKAPAAPGKAETSRR